MKIKDIEVDFNFLDADDIEKFEQEAKKVVDKCEKEEIQELEHSEAIRQECNIIEEFFDGVFGKGLSEKLFKGKKNLLEHIKAFEDIMKMKEQNQSELQSVLNRYQPNREQRRYNNFNKGKR